MSDFDDLDFSNLTCDETVDTFLNLCKSTNGAEEVELLRNENSLLKSKQALMESELSCVQKELAWHQHTSAKEQNETISRLQTEFESVSQHRRDAFDLLKTHYNATNEKLRQSEDSMKTVEANVTEDVSQLHERSVLLFNELNMHLYNASNAAAKQHLEQSSDVSISIDKQGSLKHPDTQNMALVNVTDASNANAKGLANPTRLALCTRDQIRLIVTGELAIRQALGDVTWSRSYGGSAFVPIYNAGGRARLGAEEGSYTEPLHYIPSIDDLFCTLRGQFTDPMSGATVYSEIGPVLPDPELIDMILESVRRNEAEFKVRITDQDLEVLRPYLLSSGSVDSKILDTVNLAGLGDGMGAGSSGVSSECQLHLSRRKLKIGKKKFSVKQPLDEGVFIEPHADSDISFALYIYGHGLNCEASSRQERDAIVTLTRLFMQQNAVYSYDGWERGLNGLLAEPVERRRERVYSVCYLMSHMNQHMRNVLQATKTKTQVMQAYPPPPQTQTNVQLRFEEQARDVLIIRGKEVEAYNNTHVDTIKTNEEIALLNTLPLGFEQYVHQDVHLMNSVEFVEFSVSQLNQVSVEGGTRKKTVIPKFDSNELFGKARKQQQSGPRASVIGPNPRASVYTRRVPLAPTSVEAYAPADIDDLIPSTSSNAVSTSNNNEGASRGFGSLVRRDESSDEEGEEEEGSKSSKRSQHNNGEEAHEKPAIQVIIKDKDTAVVASAEDVKSMAAHIKLSSTGTTSKRTRKTIVSKQDLE